MILSYVLQVLAYILVFTFWFNHVSRFGQNLSVFRYGVHEYTTPWFIAVSLDLCLYDCFMWQWRLEVNCPRLCIPFLSLSVYVVYIFQFIRHLIKKPFLTYPTAVGTLKVLIFIKDKRTNLPFFKHYFFCFCFSISNSFPFYLTLCVLWTLLKLFCVPDFCQE